MLRRIMVRGELSDTLGGFALFAAAFDPAGEEFCKTFLKFGKIGRFFAAALQAKLLHNRLELLEWTVGEDDHRSVLKRALPADLRDQLLAWNIREREIYDDRGGLFDATVFYVGDTLQRGGAVMDREDASFKIQIIEHMCHEDQVVPVVLNHQDGTRCSLLLVGHIWMLIQVLRLSSQI